MSFSEGEKHAIEPQIATVYIMSAADELRTRRPTVSDSLRKAISCDASDAWLFR